MNSNPGLGCVAGTPSTKPYALSAVTGRSFTYDCDGNVLTNVISGSAYTYTYDAENHEISIANATTPETFVYDGDGNKVVEIYGGITVTRLSNYVVFVSPSTLNKYYYDGKRLVASQTGSGVSFYFSDLLGSTNKISDYNGNQTAELRYTAFGDVRYSSGSIWTTSDHFTGQVHEAGIYWYNSRWYDQFTKRFMQPDNIDPVRASVQALNRYSYTQNNPTTYSDPTGHMPTDGCQQGEGCDPNAASAPASPALPFGSQLNDGGGGDPVLSPFSYDTLTIQGRGIGKALLGVEFNFSVNLDIKAWRQRGLTSVDQALSVSADASLSFGASAEIAGGLSVLGSDGSVKSQRGVQIIGKDGIPGRLIGCYKLCLGAQGTYNPRAQNGVASQMGYFVGYGYGIDAGVALVQASDWFGYIDPKTSVGPQLPFLNQQFWDDLFH